MKLLITGGAGYIGGVVTRHLSRCGHEITVLDDLSTGHVDGVPSDVTLVPLPIMAASRVLTSSAGFDGVIHLAARALVGESARSPGLYWDVNVNGTREILRAMASAGTPFLAFSSTSSMYEDLGDEPITEKAAISPRNPYAATKLAAERAISAAARQHGIAAVTLRYGNAAGATCDVQERHHPETHLIPSLLAAAAAGLRKVTVNGTDYPTPDGTCVRDYIHVRDIASAHERALDHLVRGEHRIYNIGSGHGISNLEMVRVVSKVTGAGFEVTFDDRRSGDAARTILSNGRARIELDWQPRHSAIDEIVGDAWRFRSGGSDVR